MNERRRFTTGEYQIANGYPVFDRGQLVAVFIEQAHAIQYCRMLRAAPCLADAERNMTGEEIDEVEA